MGPVVPPVYLSVLLGVPAIFWAREYEHMVGWDHSHGVGMIFGPVLWMTDLGLVVAGLIWLVRGGDGTSSQRKASGAQSELDMRFARGEIDS
ncbi:hypothetical protein [Phaeobacter gallaeciensis]|uniref:hypothetical protein n=1 Tax=Phaeobacter gallaeciensis TaxID=60890 RepID=UPI00237F0223|nr:hypothetical protein [Phaeobacter gallaeciensis]